MTRSAVQSCATALACSLAILAQLVEHVFRKDGVPSSILGDGSAIKENDFLAGFWRAERSSAQGFKGLPTASRFFRVRFEPKIFWREIFLEGRSFVFAISSSVTASFIHSRVGSIHAEGVRKRRPICSSIDFLSDISE